MESCFLSDVELLFESYSFFRFLCVVKVMLALVETRSASVREVASRGHCWKYLAWHIAGSAFEACTAWFVPYLA